MNDATAPTPEERLWTVADVMRHLSVGKTWVYDKAAAGLLPCVRIFGLLRFDPEAIRALGRGEQPATGRVVGRIG